MGLRLMERRSALTSLLQNDHTPPHLANTWGVPPCLAMAEVVVEDTVAVVVAEVMVEEEAEGVFPDPDLVHPQDTVGGIDQDPALLPLVVERHLAPTPVADLALHPDTAGDNYIYYNVCLVL